MIQHDDTFKAQKRANAHRLSTPHMRALRKELLIARADVERMELAQASADLRYNVTHFSILKWVLPGRTGRGSANAGMMSRLTGMLGGSSKGGLSGIGMLLKQYPVVSSLASLVLTKPVRQRLLRSARPLLKWGGLGLVGWEAYRVWQQMKSGPTPTPESPPEVIVPDA